MATKVKSAEHLEAVENLRKLCPKGSTVYGIVRHVSKSGMMRRISFYSIQDNEPHFLDGYMSRLGIAKRSKRTRGEGLVISGCGMDMVFGTVYELSQELYGEGYALKNQAL